MTFVLGVASTALAAQSKRLEVSAANVANLHSRGVQPGSPAQPGDYVPHVVALSAIAGGGVQARSIPVTAPSYLAVEPGAPGAGTDGVVARPNVSLEREVVTQIAALHAFKAALAVVETENERLGALLDLTS